MSQVTQALDEINTMPAERRNALVDEATRAANDVMDSIQKSVAINVIQNAGSPTICPSVSAMLCSSWGIP